MSKSRGNTVEPMAVMERHGADAVRLFLVTASQVWKPRAFDEAVIRGTAGRFLVTLKNLYSGVFALYANFGWAPSPADPGRDDRPALDRWVLSRLATAEAEANRLLDEYDATGAARAVMEFVDDDVSKWYVRRSRERFWDVHGPDSRAAFATLHEVLVASCRLLAPFAPFVTDWMHRELTGTSVHVAPYVRPEPFAPKPGARRGDARDPRARHARPRGARGGGRERAPAARADGLRPAAPRRAGRRVRAGSRPVARGGTQREVGGVRVERGRAGVARGEAELPRAGQRWGKETPRAAAAVAALSSDVLRAFERGEPVVIGVDGTDHQLTADEVTIHRRASGPLVVQEDGARFAAIDTTVTPELRAEGMAREMVSRIQRLQEGHGARRQRPDPAAYRRAGRAARDRRAAPAVDRRRSAGPGDDRHRRAPGRSIGHRPRTRRHDRTPRTHTGQLTMAPTANGEKNFRPMAKKQIAHFEKRLLEERARVLKELGHYDETFSSTLQGADGDLSSYSFHMADQGTDAMRAREGVPVRVAGGPLSLAHQRGAAPAVPRAGEVRPVPPVRRRDRLRAPRRAAARALCIECKEERKMEEVTPNPRLFFGVVASVVLGRRLHEDAGGGSPACRRASRAGARRTLRFTSSTIPAPRSACTSVPGRAGSSLALTFGALAVLLGAVTARRARATACARSPSRSCAAARSATSSDRLKSGRGVVDFIDVGVGGAALADVQRGRHGRELRRRAAGDRALARGRGRARLRRRRTASWRR